MCVKLKTFKICESVNLKKVCVSVQIFDAYDSKLEPQINKTFFNRSKNCPKKSPLQTRKKFHTRL